MGVDGLDPPRRFLGEPVAPTSSSVLIVIPKDDLDRYHIDTPLLVFWLLPQRLLRQGVHASTCSREANEIGGVEGREVIRACRGGIRAWKRVVRIGLGDQVGDDEFEELERACDKRSGGVDGLATRISGKDGDDGEKATGSCPMVVLYT